MSVALQVFSKDESGLPRTWGPRVDIPAVNQQARAAAAQLLAQLAVIRLDLHQARTPSHALSSCLGSSLAAGRLT